MVPIHDFSQNVCEKGQFLKDLRSTSFRNLTFAHTLSEDVLVGPV
jgi:hypothetical protein